MRADMHPDWNDEVGHPPVLAPAPALLALAPACPFLGTWWDAGTRHGYATKEGRCFAISHVMKHHWLLKKTVPGGQVELEVQREFCFSKYTSCEHYVARQQTDDGR